LHAGDLVATAVLEELRAFAPVDAVVGNMDDVALHAELPERAVVDVEGVRIGLVHDAGPRAGRADRLVASFPECGVVVYGHTHEPEVNRVGNVWILNPGSPTERRRARAHTMIALRVEDGSAQPELLSF
jgi:putative phosphoesterase